MKTKVRFALCLRGFALAAWALLVAAGARGDQSGFDLNKLRPIVHDKATPAAERIARGVAYLKHELTSPGPRRENSHIDTDYIQGVIVGSLSFPASEAPEVLRRYRDQTADKRLRDLLTISLGLTGARDTLPDLLRLARNDPSGPARVNAIRALGRIAARPRPTDIPPRLRPGEVWHPLSEPARQQVVDALMKGLKDPFEQPRVTDVGPPGPSRYYPVQLQAAEGLRNLGYRAEPTQTGWRVLDPQGQPLREVRLDKANLKP